MALVLGCVWIVLANLMAMLPSRDRHWTAAYGLIALGAPLLVWIAVSSGIWIALLFLAAGLSILRWPFIYASRRVRRMLTGRSIAND